MADDLEAKVVALNDRFRETHCFGKKMFHGLVPLTYPLKKGQRRTTG